MALLSMFSLVASETADQAEAARGNELITASLIEKDFRGFCWMKVKNASSQDYCYDGHSESAGIYSLEVYKDGKWEDRSPDWCGTGVKSFDLPAQSEVFISISYLEESIEDVSKFRIKFRVMKGAVNELKDVENETYEIISPQQSFLVKAKE